MPLYTIFSPYSETEWTVFQGHLRDGGRVKVTVGPIDLPSLTPAEADSLAQALTLVAKEINR